MSPCRSVVIENQHDNRFLLRSATPLPRGYWPEAELPMMLGQPFLGFPNLASDYSADIIKHRSITEHAAFAVELMRQILRLARNEQRNILVHLSL